MNSNRHLLLWLVAITLLSHPRQAAAQGTTAFTYQGQLRDGGTNANGTYTMAFKLYDAVSGGGQIGSTISNSPTLANGLFSVNLDFGAGAFNGAARWLDITVQAGTNTAETLSPRVQVLPAPYAQFAAVAATVTNGAIKNAQMAANAIATTNIQNGAITIAQIANGAVTNANLTANAVATANIQNDTVTDAKIVSLSGSKVSGAVALATNANYAGSANELHTSVVTGGFSNLVTTSWDVFPALAASPGIVPHDLVFSANGAAQMVIRPNGQGAFVHGLPISPVPNGIQVFTASGTFTVPTNITRIMVEMWGGGGGGNGNFFSTTNMGDVTHSGGGGGGGGYGIQLFNVTPGGNYSVSVGAGGNQNQAGTSSSFGGLLVAGGGSGGGNATGADAVSALHGAGGAGGTTSGSIFPGAGSDGGGGATFHGGIGGTAFRGGQGGLGQGVSGHGPGGGGGGGGGFSSDYSGNGSVGASGVVLVNY